MKKILPLILLVIALGSCSEDIKFNNEAVFQGVVDNVSWKGGNAKGSFDENGKLIIEAATLVDHMKLEIPEPPLNIDPKNKNTFVTYILGTSNIRKAYFTKAINGNTYDYETSTGVGDGQIVISQYDGVTISGTFRFNAKNVDPDSEAAPIVNVQSGVLYKVPVF